jgi:cytochrome c-type biogenesis protein CcsB
MSEFPGDAQPLAGADLMREMDNLAYRCLGAGFALLTAGLISGAVWANEAWGSYWSWDPKETWALITWLVYATYLHSRLVAGKSKKEVAVVGALGFIVVWTCYVGVNLWGVGLHSYGWFANK